MGTFLSLVGIGRQIVSVDYRYNWNQPTEFLQIQWCPLLDAVCSQHQELDFYSVWCWKPVQTDYDQRRYWCELLTSKLKLRTRASLWHVFFHHLNSWKSSVIDLTFRHRLKECCDSVYMSASRKQRASIKNLIFGNHQPLFITSWPARKLLYVYIMV